MISTTWLLQTFLKLHEVINKIISCDSSHVVHVGIWPKFGNSKFSKNFYERSYHKFNVMKI